MDLSKSTGIDAVTVNSSDTWKIEYRYWAHTFFYGLQVGEVFSGDQVNAYVEEHAACAPHCPQAKSAGFHHFVKRLMAAGKVVVDGFRVSTRTSNHHHYYRTYRRVA